MTGENRFPWPTLISREPPRHFSLAFRHNAPNFVTMPLSYVLHTRSVGLPNFAKSCLRAARSSRASRNLRRSAWRLTGGGSVGCLPWVTKRWCREFQPAPVPAAGRSWRTAYIARDPQLPPFPTQNGPTGFPRRPRRAAVVMSRRQMPACTSMGTNHRVHAAREGLAACVRLPTPFPRGMTHDSRTSQSNSQPASRFAARCHYGGHLF